MTAMGLMIDGALRWDHKSRQLIKTTFSTLCSGLYWRKAPLASRSPAYGVPAYDGVQIFGTARKDSRDFPGQIHRIVFSA